jgi:hypothetical protein
MIAVANPAGCDLKQLTMRKFDVKRNCLFGKALKGLPTHKTSGCQRKAQKYKN